MKQSALGWFEIPASDFKRAKTFYQTILDEELQDMNLGDLQMAGFNYDYMNGVGGAIVYGDGSTPGATGTTVYLNGGDDLSVVLNKVEKAGGQVVIGKTQITPEFGYYAIFIDTEGNKVGLHSMN